MTLVPQWGIEPQSRAICVSIITTKTTRHHYKFIFSSIQYVDIDTWQPRAGVNRSPKQVPIAHKNDWFKNLTKSYSSIGTLIRACFVEMLQNFRERPVLWRMYSIVSLAFTLRLPIQTSLSVAPKLQVCVRSGEKCQKFRKTATPLCSIR